MIRTLLAALVCCGTTALAADLTLVNEVLAGGKKREVTLSVKGSKASFELKEADGPTRSMLRDIAAKTLYVIDHERKLVMVITEQDSKALEARQAQFREQLKGQLEKMTPEQRARVEQTMLGQGEGKPPAYTYEKKKTPARKIGNYSCQDYVIQRDGKAGGEGCFASWKDMGISAEEFKKVMTDVMPKAGPGGGPMQHGLDEALNAPGFPVWRQHVDGSGVVTTETTLKSLTKTAVAANKFEVPKDYAQKSMADSMKNPPAPPPGAPTKPTK